MLIGLVWPCVQWTHYSNTWNKIFIWYVTRPLKINHVRTFIYLRSTNLKYSMPHNSSAPDSSHVRFTLEEKGICWQCETVRVMRQLKFMRWLYYSLIHSLTYVSYLFIAHAHHCYVVGQCSSIITFLLFITYVTDCWSLHVFMHINVFYLSVEKGLVYLLCTFSIDYY